MSWPLGDLPSLIILSAAVLAALAVIGRALRSGLAWCRMVARQLRAMGDIVERELETDDNGGNSIKDDVHGIAVAVGHLQRRASELARKQKQEAQRIQELSDRIDFHHPVETKKEE